MWTKRKSSWSFSLASSPYLSRVTRAKNYYCRELLNSKSIKLKFLFRNANLTMLNLYFCKLNRKEQAKSPYRDISGVFLALVSLSNMKWTRKNSLWYFKWQKKCKSFRLFWINCTPYLCPFLMCYSKTMVFFSGMRLSAVKVKRHTLIIH